MPDERVAIFIDGSNLFHALQTDFGRTDVDFGLLAQKLIGNRRLVRVYYYTAVMDQNRDPTRYAKTMRFLDALRERPYFTVVLGRLEPRPNGSYVEKGVDISLAVDLLELAFNNVYDTAVIVSGDGDFAKAVEVVERLGKHVENASTPRCLSRHLQHTCDVTRILDATFLSDCWRKPAP
jgi:uncharacterized LabA/DUF88 family protein